MKNLKKISKAELKQIKGSGLVCSSGYYWCKYSQSCISEERVCIYNNL
ncbi:hypothetical protein MUU74_02205 [Chryseobacterium daecheongense]|nr:hypothetical protein [Chryseobacterium daecheongense]UOU98772.1 hypothetical protein MUU74_02205 [Chryseobacterium daecheongense]